jgi:hypothetical protein
MSNVKEISVIERIFFEVKKIERDIGQLKEILAAVMQNQHSDKPRTDGMLDPRTNKLFRKKKEK